MPKEQSPGKPTTRRYSSEEKAAAVRMVRTLREELGTEQGTVARVARQLGYGVESVRSWYARQTSTTVTPRCDDRGVSEGQRARARDPRTEAGQRDSETSGEFLRGGARPPTQEIVDFIDANREEFSGRAHLHGPAQRRPAGGPEHLLRRQNPPAVRGARRGPGPALRQLWEDNYCVYGARKLWKTARRAGHDVGRDQVARLMRAVGIQGVRRGKRVRTTKPDPAAARHPDLVKRKFTATAPNQLWVTDLTFVPTWAGVAYVCFIVDAYSRMIVGWRVASHMRTTMVLDAIEMARWSRGNQLPDLVCHPMPDRSSRLSATVSGSLRSARCPQLARSGTASITPSPRQ
ncbi:IS3 family transposase [Mycolicibacterium agri]|uniref:IS3 family transposase n=1 Tax=Mycolicibacterium agri TaxID=36811 RepID=UPI001EEF6F75|nr:IS3 family transposase [Mycolicibacterium agri]